MILSTLPHSRFHSINRSAVALLFWNRDCPVPFNKYYYKNKMIIHTATWPFSSFIVSSIVISANVPYIDIVPGLICPIYPNFYYFWYKYPRVPICFVLMGLNPPVTAYNSNVLNWTSNVNQCYFGLHLTSLIQHWDIQSVN